MNIEDQLRSAWNAESGGHLDLDDLTERVRRQRRRRYLQRAMELILTVVAIAVFAHALITQSMAPAHWLLLPFFAVFLPTVWILTLRGPRLDTDAATAPTHVYAQLRLAQLKTSLRDLWLARRSALGLLIYALLACIGAWWFGDVQWRESALVLLFYSSAWLVATLILARRLGPRRSREYRNLRALLED
ncbi:MAG: hypothetical protein ACNA7J_11310 [Wenzhouxiangella sp.]